MSTYKNPPAAGCYWHTEFRKEPEMTATVRECRTKNGPWLKWSYEVWVREGERNVALLYVDSIHEAQRILNQWNVRLDYTSLEGVQS